MRFALLVTVLAACVGSSLDDDEMYLTGTEEEAVMRNGALSCDNGKVLVCHIPPGNPDNAHTICVGAPAVDAHVERHDDPIGPCDLDDDDVPPPDDDVPPPDEGEDSGDPIVL